MPPLSWPQLEEISATVDDAAFAAGSFTRFVETGTGIGQTIIPLANHFQELHTVEIKEEFYEASRLMGGAAKAPIHFYHGASEDVLLEILPTLNGPSVFFLDAHWSGEDTGRGAVDVPLLQELQSLDALFPHRALVILDDYRLFAEAGRRETCEVDWSPISVEAVHASVRPERVARAFVLGDRYILALREAPGKRPPAGRPPPGRGGRGPPPFVSSPRSPLDREALAELAGRGDEYLVLARRIRGMYPLGLQ